MSGFSSDWLALREPVDHRSRNLSLQAKVINYLSQIKTVYPDLLCFTDLGSGTGSNLRALAPHIDSDQHWTLVDYDANLLHTAREALLAWGDSEINSSEALSTINSSISIKPLSILKQGKKIVVEFKCVDLLNDYQAILNESADLITSAAFFDLVAEPWLRQFCAALSKPLYTVLTYDGMEMWSPGEEIDADVLKAFHQHQRTNKGFGSALGPAAAGSLEALLKAQHFNTVCASSPWILDLQDGDLIEQLAIGTASAAREMDVIPSIAVNQWEESRRQASQCEIGHIDLFAYKA
jgi:hypothetical protein